MKFTPIENKSITEFEQETLKYWKDNKIFEKSVEQRNEDNLYVFYDGPPFVSGLPHYGHLLGSIAKDLVPRYWTMKGKRVERVWGWDAHGLTVENKVQKKLGIQNRKEIEGYGLKEFTEACYEYVQETSAEWNWYIDRIARWVDMDNAYRTTDQNYMESVIWAFKQLYDKGLIYEGVRTSLYCTTCGTPVSNFEVAMDDSYKDMDDPAITVEFPVTGSEFDGQILLAWTTTPWTIPSNRALVLDPEETYVSVTAAKKTYIVAKKRLEAVFEGVSYTVSQEFKGTDLLGVSYEPPYSFFASGENAFKVYSYDGMVNMEEGTGIVHSAPGFGEIDTEMGRENSLRIMLTINDEGHFEAGDAGENPFAWMYYAKANKYIREDLKNRGLLFKDEVITHRFPYHDRCDTPLIQKAQKSWFIDVAKLKPELLKNNENINWVPESIKTKRFPNIIKQAPDWCISRSRFWATPMPVWQSEDDDRIVVGSIEELEELSGQKVENLHRPYIDEITIKKDGKVYKRIPEVLDSWFEAGSMPYAQVHYPFENKEKFEKNFPGDYIVEYTAQVRAWFNVMHRLSTALFGSNSFKNVVVTGVLAGNDGRKMSKTYGNYADPKEILETIGGDALRLYLMNSPLMMAGRANFDEEDLKSKSKTVLNTLLNSLNYFLIFAEEYEWSPKKSEKSDNILDEWLTTKLHETIKNISENIESYHIPPAVQAVEDFVDDLSRWYIRRSRDRISIGDNKALSTLYNTLLEFSKAAAPVVPFISERIYQSLKDEKDPESVHLCEYPNYEAQIIEKDAEIVERMKIVRDICSAALSIRSEKQVGVRQPLATLYTKSSIFYEDIIKDEVNVKKIEQVTDLNSLDDKKYAQDASSLVALDLEITEELSLEGSARNIVRKLQSLRKKQGLSVSDQINSTLLRSDKEVLKKHEKYIKENSGTATFSFGDEYAVEKI